LLLLLVEVALATGDLAAAHHATEQLAALAQQTQSDVLLAQAALAAGQVQRQAGEPAAADSFQSVLTHMPHGEQSLLAARARLEMAQLLADSDWAGAVTWARAALASFERIGAEHDAGAAAALLRRLGVTERARPRLDGQLSRRESDVLELLGHGLTNREIAERLFISPKTAEHHVSQILGKLGLRSRAEVAAWLARGSVAPADGQAVRGPK
jgi:DNA-binding NarL/FixJ family response regulator